MDMNCDKKLLVRSILKFIKDELSGTSLDAEQKESLDVARQCLETTYEISSTDTLSDTTDVKAFFQIKPEVQVTEEMKAEAENCKMVGNECMKNGQFAEALMHYTKAIELNPKNAVYYCNRAAAYSRLDKHNEVITDCQEAIKLDPNYGKAYGRLGIAYSNMGRYKEAKESYAKARQLDPTNTTYEANYALAEEKLNAETAGAGAGMPGGAAAANSPFNISNFMNNPALLNMASQMLNDPTFRNMVSGIMESGGGVDQSVDGFMQLGQQLAQQLQNSNPAFIDNLRQSFGVNPNAPSSNPSDNPHNPDSTGDH